MHPLNVDDWMEGIGVPCRFTRWYLFRDVHVLPTRIASMAATQRSL